MHKVFAGAQSVPVINQALSILGDRFKMTVVNDEELDTVPPSAIFLARCDREAQFPSRFLRQLPELPLKPEDDPAFIAVMNRRRDECARRRFGIPDQVLTLPQLVLVRSAYTKDGTYTSIELDGFITALKDLAGIRSAKVRRNRGRQSGRRHGSGFGIQPYLVA